MNKDNSKLLIFKFTDIAVAVKGTDGNYPATYTSLGVQKAESLKIKFEPNEPIKALDGAKIGTGFIMNMETVCLQFEDRATIEAYNNKTVKIKITGRKQGDATDKIYYLKDIDLMVKSMELNPYAKGESSITLASEKEVLSTTEVLSETE